MGSGDLLALGRVTAFEEENGRLATQAAALGRLGDPPPQDESDHRLREALAPQGEPHGLVRTPEGRRAVLFVDEVPSL